MNVKSALSEHLLPLGFKEYQSSLLLDSDLTILKMWRRRTLNMNRGVALIECKNNQTEFGKVAQSLKFRLGRELGYFPFLYEIGLQIVFYSREPVESVDDLQGSVDAVNNQFVVLQSIFVVDESRRKVSSARTWGQIMTKPFQDAIEVALKESVKVNE